MEVTVRCWCALRPLCARGILGLSLWGVPGGSWGLSEGAAGFDANLAKPGALLDPREGQSAAPGSAPTAPAVPWQLISCSAAAPEVVLQVKPHSQPSPPPQSRKG